MCISVLSVLVDARLYIHELYFLVEQLNLKYEEMHELMDHCDMREEYQVYVARSLWFILRPSTLMLQVGDL